MRIELTAEDLIAELEVLTDFTDGLAQEYSKGDIVAALENLIGFFKSEYTPDAVVACYEDGDWAEPEEEDDAGDASPENQD